MTIPYYSAEDKIVFTHSETVKRSRGYTGKITWYIIEKSETTIFASGEYRKYIMHDTHHDGAAAMRIHGCTTMPEYKKGNKVSYWQCSRCGKKIPDIIKNLCMIDMA